MENSPKIDCHVSARPLSRYLVKTKTTKYSRDQKVESIRHRYFFQWKNFWNDLHGLIVHPLQTYPQVSFGLSALLLVLLRKEDHAAFVFMVGALTLDVAVESNNTTSFSVTVAANSNRMMIMGFGHYQGGNNISASDYASAALSQIHTQAGSFGERAGLWGKVAPATGTNTFTITGNDAWTGYGVISIYDADQNLPTNTTGASDDTSVDLTTTVANAWVVAAIGAEPAITMTTTSGVEDMNEQGASYQNAEMHHVEKAAAGAQTISFSLGYGARSNISMCEVKPAGGGGGGPTNHFLGIMGVGA